MEGGEESGIHSNEFAILRNQIAQIFLSPSYAMQPTQVREEGREEGTDGSVDPPVAIAQMGPN